MTEKVMPLASLMAEARELGCRNMATLATLGVVSPHPDALRLIQFLNPARGHSPQGWLATFEGETYDHCYEWKGEGAGPDLALRALIQNLKDDPEGKGAATF